jgi:hypothetical protein
VADDTAASDDRHECAPDFGWLMLPRGAGVLDSIRRAADYGADTEAGQGHGRRSSPEIRHERNQQEQLAAKLARVMLAAEAVAQRRSVRLV